MAHFDGVRIYVITNNVNGKRYVGITTKTIEERFASHIRSAKGKWRNYKILRAIRKYRSENFKVELLETVKTKTLALERETYYIKSFDSFNRGYNMNVGGTGNLYASAETKLKMSQNNCWRGKKRNGALNPMFGQTHTAEARTKISAKLKGGQPRLGAVLSDETKEKIRKANTNPSEETRSKMRVAAQNRSPETIEKMRQAKLGKKVYSSRRYLVIHPNGIEEIVNRLSDFATSHNLNLGNLCAVLNANVNINNRNKWRTCTGFTGRTLQKDILDGC